MTQRELYDLAISYKQLMRSAKSCTKGITWKGSAALLKAHYPVKVIRIHDALKHDTYKSAKPHRFVVHEPKERTVDSVQLLDRVVQKSLCENFINPILYPTFIYDNGASIPCKGISFSMKRLHVHMRKMYRNYGKSWYILKCDISNYFGSINHEILINKLSKYIVDKRVINVIKDSLKYYGINGVGIGLGSQLNQTFALFYLSSMDHMIKEDLHIECYARYMDDFYLMHYDKNYLAYCKNIICEYLKELQLTIHPNKTTIIHCKNGMNYLGFRHCITDTGYVIKSVLKSSVHRHRRRLYKLHYIYMNDIDSPITFQSIWDSHMAWRSHILRGNNYFDVFRLDTLFYNMFYNDINHYSSERYKYKLYLYE